MRVVQANKRNRDVMSSALLTALLLLIAQSDATIRESRVFGTTKSPCSKQLVENESHDCETWRVRPLLVVRGGGSANDDTSKATEEEFVSNDEEKTSKKSRFWNSMSDVFQLNDQVKEEASPEKEEEKVLGRGGALVATTTRKRPVLDTSRVATASSRLLQPANETSAVVDGETDHSSEGTVEDGALEMQIATDITKHTSKEDQNEDEEKDYYDAVEQQEDEELEGEEDFYMDSGDEEDEEIEYYRDDSSAVAISSPQPQQQEEECDNDMTDEAAKLWFANEWWRMQLVTRYIQERRLQRLEKQKLLQQYALEDDDESDEWTLEEAEQAKKREVETTKTERPPQAQEESRFISSGYWGTIDKVVSLGLSSSHENLRLSRRLRAVRKAAAHATGLHGLVSGKTQSPPVLMDSDVTQDVNEGDLLLVRRRIAAIDRARQLVEEQAAEEVDEIAVNATQRGGIFKVFRRRRQRRRGRGRGQEQDVDDKEPSLDESLIVQELALRKLEDEKAAAERKSRELEELKRRERVMEIDRLITRGQRSLVELQCEKDELQRRPNPLYNYTTENERTTRDFNFPPQELVDEYLEELFASGRLVKLNHTQLWKSGADMDDEGDETIGEDLLTPSGDAHKLYEAVEERRRGRAKNGGRRNVNGNGGGGSWFLRIGKGTSLGEKIGEAVETSGYKAVCGAVMAALARSISALHGINVMTHSDIRLFIEKSPDWPPVGKSLIPGSEDSENYAQAAIKKAIQRGSKKKRRSRASRVSEDAFLQRDAVVETLISHCQISAPLLKLFPLAWQRGLLGNMITMIAAVVSDFADGIQLQILGHQLSFSFKPITERDMIAQMSMNTGYSYNSRLARPEEFEAAVRATAQDVSEGLKFLDRWHERALGSGMLRAQIANLIARIVLTLADEVLSGARMDLWSAHAGGPRIVAGLEYRTAPAQDAT